MYPLELKLFPIDEDWATGDEHLDKKLNNLLLNCFSNLTLNSIQNFYIESHLIKTRVANPSFNLVLELCTKALIGIHNKNLEVDQELLKIKGRMCDFEENTKKINIELNELSQKKHQRLFSSIDIFQREQIGFEQNPFVAFKLKKSEKYFELKFIFKDLVEKLKRQDSQSFEIEILDLLSQKYIVNIAEVGKVWFFEEKIYCVNH
jgi:hypothetical protein